MVIKRRGLLLVTVLIVLISPWTWQLPRLIRGYRLSPAPIWQVTPIEVQKININRSLFPKTPAGKILSVLTQNKAVVVLEKFLTNAYEYLDWNYYFFAGHPRERVGVQEIEKLPWWLLPFFVFGLFHLPKNKKLLLYGGGWFISGVFALSILGLTDNMSSFILFPPLVVVTALGITKIYEKK